MLVSSVHAVDGFGQLCAAGLVNAASVNPDMGQLLLGVVLASLFAAHIYLLVALFVLPITVSDLLERNFLTFPTMRQNGIARYLAAFEVFQLTRVHVQQPHIAGLDAWVRNETIPMLDDTC